MNFCGLTDCEAQPLAEAISRHNSTLTNLSLSHNSIKHKGAGYIFRAMATQTSCMVAIDLSYNQIDDQSEVDLCHLVRAAPKALERIKLANNCFVEVARALVVALKFNSRLKVLDLNKNLTDLRCQKEIEALVQKNKEQHEKLSLANLEQDRTKLRDKIRDHKGKTEKDLATASKTLAEKTEQLREEREAAEPEKQRIKDKSKTMLSEHAKNREYLEQLDIKLTD